MHDKARVVIRVCNEHPSCTVGYFEYEGGCPDCAEIARLKAQRCVTTTTVYRETEATQKKLEFNAETIRNLERRVTELSHPAATITELRAEGAEKSDEIAELKREAEMWKQRHELSAGLLVDERKETENLSVRCREYELVVDGYRDKHKVMEEKIEELTPGCHVCGDDPSGLVCPACSGFGPGCLTCGGSGGVKACGECGRETGS